MYDATTIALGFAAFAGFALVAHWVTSRYQRFMNAPRSPQALAVARRWFRFWNGVQAFAAYAAGVALGGLLGGVWGAGGGFLLVGFIRLCIGVERTR